MINEQKAALRDEIKKLKKQIPLEERINKSTAIFNEIEKLDIFKNSKTIMCYWAMNDEVLTQNFIKKWYNDKKIILPCVRGSELILKVFSGEKNMDVGESFGIAEPKGDKFTDYNAIDMIIIPGIAFDKQNNRMGRGKAYYDKILKNMKGFKLAVAFDVQVIDEIPTDEHDIKMDMIVSA